ncbi:hypothetical protein TRIUR3_26765 [Triticum urartu]|uniref:Uncharacterized protein n=1 Tax=Triticum urartu TaxID=4572 RepID=M7YVB2_TRIUA|nr:hypothetical protein TRIUR3_26765 [Triticum urartu]
MRPNAVTLLLPLAFLLLLLVPPLAPAEARSDCTSQVIDPMGKKCDRAGCYFSSRVAYAQIGCHKPAEELSHFRLLASSSAWLPKDWHITTDGYATFGPGATPD